MFLHRHYVERRVLSAWDQVNLTDAKHHKSQDIICSYNHIIVCLGLNLQSNVECDAWDIEKGNLIKENKSMWCMQSL
ncbi:unnamed protein product [Cuscuta campestris]|uniref:Uncharacterized protein n=1 Tax=Cuscuta campestris TaxID=132261 RepID=A0A484NJJ8_9ASTE|nr:unnamed protein product [Cuscuta campestris]